MLDPSVIAAEMPVFAACMGVWDGTYVHYDAAMRETDRHDSRLICRLEDGPDGLRLFQTNIYSWADGRQAVLSLYSPIVDRKAQYRDGDKIEGHASDIDQDATRRAAFVTWTRPSDPDLQYYELVTLSPCRSYKNRVWHGYRGGRLAHRVVIDEVKVADDCTAYDRPEYRAQAEAKTIRLP